MAMTAVGTPYYLCPEICKGEKYSLKSDMWSLGIILYELCSLRRPFQGENIYAVMKSIMNGKFEDIPNNYTEELFYVLNRCLDKNSHTRIDSTSLLE